MNGSKQTATQVVGVDIAKRVFQLHWIDVETGEIMSVQLKREKLLEHFANRAGCLIGMEACGGAQHWARKLIELGHAVKLLPAKMVKPFVGRNKSDAADARAIWTAVQQPAVKAVAVKSEAQQAVLALHRMRSQLVKFRTAQINGLRGLLAEYGEVMPQGRAGITKGIAAALAQLVDRLPAVLLDTLREQWARVGQLDEQVAEIERRLRAWHTYLRTLLIHGARSVIVNSKQPSAWVTNLTQRRAANVAVVALANKMARTIWALLAHERAFQKGYVSQPV